MKLVIDSNLLISGTLWDGSPARLLNAVLNAPGTLCLSAEILLEFSEVLSRREFAGRLSSKGISAAEVIQRYQRLGRRVSTAELPNVPSLRDPKDLKILAAAVGAKADAIVTGDNDLLVMQEFAGIPIIRVEEALERFSS